MKTTHLAYYDSMSGLIPVIITRRLGAFFDVKVNSDKFVAYRRGEIVNAVPIGRIVHRDRRYTQNHKYQIWPRCGLSNDTCDRSNGHDGQCERLSAKVTK